MGGELLVNDGNGMKIVRGSAALVENSLSETVAAIHRAGKRVVLVEPPPTADFDPATCNERLMERKWFFGAPVDCSIDRAMYERKTAEFRGVLSGVGAAQGVGTFSPVTSLCGATRCDTKWQEVFIYRDGGHLSYEGSVALAVRAEMLRTLVRIAQ
jgi:hypothetical protein